MKAAFYFICGVALGSVAVSSCARLNKKIDHIPATEIRKQLTVGSKISDVERLLGKADMVTVSGTTTVMSYNGTTDPYKRSEHFLVVRFRDGRLAGYFGQIGMDKLFYSPSK